MRIENQSGTQPAGNWEAAKTDQVKLPEKPEAVAKPEAPKPDQTQEEAAGLAMAGEFEGHVRAYRNASENIAANLGSRKSSDHKEFEIMELQFLTLSKEYNQISGTNHFDGMKLEEALSLTEKVRTDLVQNPNGSSVTQFNNLSRTHLLALLQ